MIRYLASIFLFLSLSGAASADTLEEVRERGIMRCGVNVGLPGFSQADIDGKWRGFDVDMCRAVAAAVLGDASKVEYVPLTSVERIKAVAEGRVDMMSRNTTWTLSRDMDMGVSFAGINYYDGQGFMVHKDKGLISALELNGATVCVEEGTTSLANVKAYFTLNRMKLKLLSSDKPEENLREFISGTCDALTNDHSALHALRSETKEPSLYKILPEVISKEPLSLVVREGDDRWRKIVQWSLFALINAETLGITQKNAEKVRELARKDDIRQLLGLAKNPGQRLGLTQGWGFRILSQVGNYGEIFARNIGKGTALGISRGLNAAWTDGGLLYAPPIR